MNQSDEKTIKEVSGDLELTKVIDSDNVNHPSHYADGKIEVIDFIEDKKLGFCLANAIKYISRAGKKLSKGKSKTDKEIEDLEKSIWYINRRIYELKEGICD